MKHNPLLLITLLFFAATGPLAAEVPDDAWQVTPLLPGQSAPAFSAPSAAGGTFDFDPSNMEKPMVMIFYRGGWCPFCSLHFAELRKAEQPLLDMGFDISFVSMDTAEIMAEALEGDDAPDYRLLSDSASLVSRAFGIAFRVDDDTVNRYRNKMGIDLEKSAGGYDHHILPVPSVFIIGKDGIVKFSYANPDYKVRLHPDVLVSAAQHMPDYRIRR